MIEATRAVFAPERLDPFNDPVHYERERQFDGLKVTQEYPLQKVDYPCIVLNYQSSLVENAGVGHYEIFPDRDGVLRLWNHNRFEGTLQWNVYALSTLDRDLLADALVEVIRFGRLDTELTTFFGIIYPSGGDDDYIALTQLMLNSDQMHGGGDSASLAPWQPEDVLVYSTSYTTELHGGYYNVIPSPELGFWTSIEIMAQMVGENGGVVNPIPEFASVGWRPPKWYQDGGIVHGVGMPSGTEG